MAVFSQEKLAKFQYTCDGCNAQCELKYGPEGGGYIPYIGNRYIPRYRDNECKGVLSKSAVCKTPLEAIKLAQDIVRFCDYYKKH